MRSHSVCRMLAILVVRFFFIVFYILVFPYYIYNKIDFKKNIKSNPMYTSHYMKWVNHSPFLYDMAMYVCNFPYPTCVYRAIPPLYGRVLQVGCGTGLLNKHYRKHKDIELVNLDINQVYLDYGVRHSRYAKTVLSDLCELEQKYPDIGLFDTIVFARCFHHIHHHKKNLAACEKLLKPGGRMIIADIASLKTYRQDIGQGAGYLVNSSTDGVIWRYTPEEFRKRIEKYLPKQLQLDDVHCVRQIHMTNYNLKYPQTDIYAIISKPKGDK